MILMLYQAKKITIKNFYDQTKSFESNKWLSFKLQSRLNSP